MGAGGRSVSGREGPVVGRRPRNIKPLNPIEIVEHWDILRDTCTTKHGLTPADQLRLSRAVIEALQHALDHGLPPYTPPQTHMLAVQQALACLRNHQVMVVAPQPAQVTAQLLAKAGYDASQFDIADQRRVHALAHLPCAEDSYYADTSGTETHVIMDTLDELLAFRRQLLGLDRACGPQALLQEQLESSLEGSTDGMSCKMRSSGALVATRSCCTCATGAGQTRACMCGRAQSTMCTLCLSLALQS